MFERFDQCAAGGGGKSTGDVLGVQGTGLQARKTNPRATKGGGKSTGGVQGAQKNAVSPPRHQWLCPPLRSQVYFPFLTCPRNPSVNGSAGQRQTLFGFEGVGFDLSCWRAGSARAKLVLLRFLELPPLLTKPLRLLGLRLVHRGRCLRQGFLLDLPLGLGHWL